jgi:hypothetical protein
VGGFVEWVGVVAVVGVGEASARGRRGAAPDRPRSLGLPRPT